MPAQPPTASPAQTLSPIPVVTSKLATDNINDIKTQHSGIQTNLANHTTQMSALTAQESQQAQLKAKEEADAKLAADKLAIEQQNADAKSAVTGTTPTKTAKTSDQLALDKANADRIKADADYQREAKNVQNTIDKISRGAVPLTAAEKAQIDSLKQQFQSLIDEQARTNIGAKGLGNIRGYQTGSAEYDPTFQTKTIGSIVTAGLNKVADLNSQMAGAVAKLELAFRDNKISAIKDAWSIYQDANAKRQDTIAETLKQTQSKIKEGQDKIAEAQKQNDELLVELSKNNAPNEVLDAVNNAPTLAEKVKAAGEYLQTGTGIVGEYAYYKKQAQAAGQTPVDFNTYQNMDANRKVSIARAGVAGTGGGGIYGNLDYRTANAVLAAANKFGDSPIVKKYNEMIAAANMIAGVDPNTTNPAEHQAVIYNFAKALDPDSVVREGEYATVKKYSQSLISKYGGEIRQAVAGTGFLSPQAIMAIQEASKNRIAAYEPQYNSLKQNTKVKINSLAGKDVADDVLIDYEEGLSSGSTSDQLIRSEADAQKRVEQIYETRANEIDTILEAEPNISYTELLQVLGN